MIAIVLLCLDHDKTIGCVKIARYKEIKKIMLQDFWISIKLKNCDPQFPPPKPSPHPTPHAYTNAWTFYFTVNYFCTLLQSYGYKLSLCLPIIRFWAWTKKKNIKVKDHIIFQNFYRNHNNIVFNIIAYIFVLCIE